MNENKEGIWLTIPQIGLVLTQLIEILYQNSKHGSAQAEELGELRKELGIVEVTD